MDEPKRGPFDVQPDPTPAEIEARCQEIRATWNDKERASRLAEPDAEPIELEPVKLEMKKHR